MSSFNPSDQIRYTAQIGGVREVSLHGTADLDFWQAHLHPHGLRPNAADGTAQVVISATALVWKGIRFRELIVIVATCIDREQPQPDSFYLAHACSSSRMLAWAERRLFSTPYIHADILLDTNAPLIDVRRNSQPLLKAQMAQGNTPATQGYEEWSGPIFLPDNSKHFFVALSGEQASYPFAATTDRFEIAAAANEPIAQWLTQSGFTPTEWRIRASANHSRSPSYRRTSATPA